ncbi:type III pantothenate kinase [Psychroflexus sp. YR1-1]|uniref:Type III pantothenate kinase n=1 Tax=Psychroflexus aurantiacus TaxID=2709310 RepID=A0A6B3R4D4_9FLAO|nr:type III pantothenate kinase [Psychroflexus aurantiacus]NEV94410.1 type III pantothenate kinase [Psychroflexus aurantiacus]
MNLVVDIGNTQIKFAVFDGDQFVEKITSSPAQAPSALQRILESYPKLTQGIISSTAELPEVLRENLSASLELIEFTHQSKVNFINAYKTPETLGLDRIALVAAAAYLFPSQNVLVIDAGTCITYDFIDENSMYHGGAISPGLQMRYKAMHAFTKKLPLLKEALPPSAYIGKSTAEAMQVGVCKSICYEIDGYIEDYLADYEDLTVVLTGGDYKLLSASIKNSIFATSNFLWKGLNKILQLNSN